MTSLNVTPGQPVVKVSDSATELPAVVKSVWVNGVFTLEDDGGNTYAPDGMQRGGSYHRAIVRLYKPGETAESIFANARAREQAAADTRAAREAAIEQNAAAALSRNPCFKKDLVRIPATMVYAGTALDAAQQRFALTFSTEERIETGYEADGEPRTVYEIRFAYARLQRDGQIIGWSSTAVKGYSLDSALGRMLASLG